MRFPPVELACLLLLPPVFSFIYAAISRRDFHSQLPGIFLRSYTLLLAFHLTHYIDSSQLFLSYHFEIQIKLFKIELTN